jgi:O-antigen/teichoic acid export membrane protein
MSNSIAKNTTFMTMASIGQKVLAFLYFTLIARIIGVENTGKYFFALSFTTVFVVFIDLGFTNVLIREASKFKKNIQSYFSTILSIKLIFAVLTYIAAIIAINVLGYEVEIKHMVYLSGITMIFDTFHLTMYGVLRSLKNLKYEAIGIAGSQGITLVLGSIFLFLGFPLIYLIFSFTFASFVNVLFVSYILIKKYNISIKPNFDSQSFKHLYIITIPFALAAIFARIYSYADTIILSKVSGDLAVGFYSIPYKITYAFQFIPLALVAAMYPKFSEYYIENKKKLAEIFEYGIKYLLVIAFPIAVGIGVLAQDIILFLYTDKYLPSVVPLQILIGSLVFSYMSFPVGAFLNACNHQKTQMKIVGIVMLANIGLNIYLIPQIGVSGAAIAAVAGNILLTIFGFMIIPQIVNISFKNIISNFLRVGISAGLMGLIVFVTKDVFYHFLFTIPLGASIYILFLFIFRVLTKEKLKEVVVLIKK